ncbi:hypothetical protein FAM15333_001710 [Propionibacterium freudenreichii]|uniref:hypothetical protein n=1 Tax=Propionibacterium freudenreichii TaxID=1744 RepID=UPI00101FE1BF|nr:hypothetical protein [Propionibacterium freudenreichii]MDK9646878.1 hypothetical protein [Propionibacterium freudenreichii]MDK9666940.1 hypothetical protein [Propionibacterium freudenreichii]
MTKSPALYRVILLVWAALFGLALLTTAGSLSREITQRPVAGVLALVTLLFIGYFWLNGIKDVLYTAWYYLVMRGRIRPVRRRELHRHPPRVVMVYCTRNDFNANSLAASMKHAVHKRAHRHPRRFRQARIPNNDRYLRGHP